MKPEDVNLDNQPDYFNQQYPDHENYEDYEWYERRALILDLMIRKGTPWLTQTKLADRFGVSNTQIHKDIVTLKVYLGENKGKDFDSLGATLYRNAIEQLQKKGEHLKAVKVFESYKEFMFETGEKHKEPERHEVRQETVVNEFNDMMDNYPSEDPADES